MSSLRDVRVWLVDGHVIVDEDTADDARETARVHYPGTPGHVTVATGWRRLLALLQRQEDRGDPLWEREWTRGRPPYTRPWWAARVDVSLTVWRLGVEAYRLDGGKWGGSGAALDLGPFALSLTRYPRA